MFRPATKHKSRLRMAIDGPSGSGKTFTSLRFATALGQRIAVINTESGAIEKYLGLSPDGVPFVFQLCELEDFSPSSYTSAIMEAGRCGFDVLLIDSLSHAWDGVGGALELVDKKGGNRFTAWKDVTPLHRRMIEAILRSPCHVIATMRSKMEYVLEQDEKGRSVPRKVGMAPIQRSGMEYEFDIVADMDWQHMLTISKTRCHLVDNAVVVKPGADFIRPVVEWLQEGSEAPEGYYTASEAEITKVLSRESAKVQVAPQKTAAEIMAEQQAAAEAATEAAAVSNPTVNGRNRTKTLTELFSQLVGEERSAEQLEKSLAKRGVQSAKSLTEEQYQEMVDRLSEKIAEATVGESAENPHATEGSVNDPCSEAVSGQIRKLLVATQDKALIDQVRDHLRCHGKSIVAELSHRDAETLLNCLQRAEMESFFKKALDPVGEAVSDPT
jgi:hypothetical protein